MTATLDHRARVDYGLVGQLRTTVADRLKSERRSRAESGRDVLSREDERQFGRDAIATALGEFRRESTMGGTPLPPAEDDQLVLDAVHAAMFGLGRLQPLIEDVSLNNIEINGCDKVWLYRNDGTVIPGPAVADSDSELVEWVMTQATYSGLSSRQFNFANPHLVIRLGDGSRLTSTGWVCGRPALSIRLYRRERVLLADLRAKESFTDEIQTFLGAGVLGRFNFLVSGETFAGKTTMLRAMGNLIPWNERIITIEHFLELGFQGFEDLHRDVVELEERPDNSEGEDGVSMLDLVEWSRRMNADRVIVGEVMGSEIVALLDAMSQGNDGSMSTIHARSSRTVFDKIALYAIKSEQRLPVEASNLLTAVAIDFVVHMAIARLPDGRMHRYVASIREVVGADGAHVISSEIFATPPGGLLAYAVPGVAISPARATKLAEHGYDSRQWRAGAQ